jgi:polyhydroxybutyrate depolymerase
MRARLRLAAVVAAAAVLAMSCSTTGDPGAALDPAPSAVVTPPSPGCEPGATDADRPRGRHADVPLRSSDVDRLYQLYVPASYGSATPTPLVIDLHGYLSGAEGQAMMSDFGTFSENAGFVVATPQGNGPLPYWNAVPHDELPDDVQFVSDVIDDVSSRLCIDPDRVYVAGFSNGAFLASLVACRLSDRVAAVAVVAGLQMPADCAPSRPVPILGIHGTDDRFVTFDGSPNVGLDSLTWNAESTRAFENLPFAPARDALAEWATINGCVSPSRDEPVAASVTVVRYDGCGDGATVELVVVEGGGHTWPGSAFSQASASILGPTTTEIAANDEIWAFFTAHPMSS